MGNSEKLEYRSIEELKNRSVCLTLAKNSSQGVEYHKHAYCKCDIDALLKEIEILKNGPPIKWEKLPTSVYWWDDTVIVGAKQLSGGLWEFHTLTINCDDDYFQLKDHDGEDFDAWDIHDFDWVALISGNRWMTEKEYNE